MIGFWGDGAYLNSAGSGRAYAMFSQFRPFGQTRGELDLSKVASISVGWGGYFGTEGEQITFLVKPPQRFVCNVKSPRAARSPYSGNSAGTRK